MTAIAIETNPRVVVGGEFQLHSVAGSDGKRAGSRSALTFGFNIAPGLTLSPIACPMPTIFSGDGHQALTLHTETVVRAVIDCADHIIPDQIPGAAGN
ncbi:MAG: hypothetical protein M3Q07_06130, partial [Pseudobdellovibrionaceae bacterium]|nr:hypothetical protein [Pseudobdellovibrionaceae bacterium]